MMVTETKEQPVSPLSPNEVLTDERALDDRPTLSQRSEAPRIEYKTLVQQLCGEGNVPKADAELNALLNAAPDAGWAQWEVFQIGDGHPVVVWSGTRPNEVQIWRTAVLFRMSEGGDGEPQAVPAPTPVPVVLPAEAGSTASTVRERLTASDFAFLTAPDKTLIEQ